MDIASLGIRVTTDGVAKAEADLSKLQTTGAKVEKSAGVIDKSFKANAKSAKELQFAIRGLPAQFTDIATGIASGQRPLQVLLQQGGQLKDMFGGIGPAVKAMGGYLMGLINPVTIAGAVIAGLGYAAYRGSEDIAELNDALSKTGGFAGASARDLNAMAVQVGAATGKFGDARDAVNELAGSGKFTGAGLAGLAKQAVDTAKVTGQSMDDVVKSIAKLNAQPAEYIAALNEQYHFLTSAQYAQIAALEEQGRTQEAARLANKLDADAMAERAKEVENNANWLVRSAHYVAAEWGKAWAAIKGAVTPAGLGEQASNLQAQIEALSKPRVDRQGNLVQGANGGEIARLKKQLADVRRQQVQQAFSDSEKALDAGLNQDSIAAQRRLAEFASPKDRLDSEIAKANRDRLAAMYGVVDPDQRAKIEAEYKAQVKAAREAYANATKDPTADFWNTSIGNDPRSDLTSSIEKEISAYGKEAQAFARSTSAAVAYKRTLDDMLETRQRAIDLQVQSIGMGQREIDQQSALIAIDEDYNRKKADLQKRQQNTTSALEREGYQQQLADLEDYHKQRVQMEVDGWKRSEEARKNAALGARAAIKDFEDAAGDVAGQTYDVFSNAFDGMSDAIAKFVQTGKLDFSELATSIIADLAKMEARILVSQALQSIFGGYGGTNGQGGVTYNDQGFVNHVYAKGGVVDGSRNLSAYSGQVVDRPTLFAFAKGNGLMGEAGPEAIMPLRRGPDGKLGVAAAGAGGGDVQVLIENHTGVQPEVSRSTGPGGQDVIKVLLKQVDDRMASNAANPNSNFGKAMKQTYGLQRRGVPVGS